MKKTTIDLPDDLANRIEALAKSGKRSFGAQIRSLTEAALKQQDAITLTPSQRKRLRAYYTASFTRTPMTKDVAKGLTILERICYGGHDQ